MSEKVANVVAQVRKAFGLKDTDTGSSYVQIAINHVTIKDLSENHFSKHKKDHHSFRGLQARINAMKSHSKYLRAKSPEKYEQLRVLLGMRK